MSQNVGYEAGRVLLIQGHRPAHVPQLLLAESRHVAWKGLGENEAPFSRFRDTELNRNHSPRLQQFREWIRATPLFLGCNARLKFFRGQVARAVQQMRELVIGACPTPRRSSSSFSEGLLDCFAGDVVAPLTSHHFVEEGSVDRKQRRPLLGTRSVVAIQPVHHESELQACRERRRRVGLHRMNSDVT